MNKLNCMNFTGTVERLRVKDGESKKGNPFHIVGFTLKQKIDRATLYQPVVTFYMKKDLPIKDGDVLCVENGVLRPNNYKDKDGKWVNQQILDASNALITNETESIILQEKNENHSFNFECNFNKVVDSDNTDSSDLDF